MTIAEADTVSVLTLVPLRFHQGIEAVKIPAGHCRIGSGDDCHIRLPVAGIAPLHVTVQEHGKQHLLTSHDKRTWINGFPVREQPIRDGDRITIGPIEFQLQQQMMSQPQVSHRRTPEHSGDVVAPTFATPSFASLLTSPYPVPPSAAHDEVISKTNNRKPVSEAATARPPAHPISILRDDLSGEMERVQYEIAHQNQALNDSLSKRQHADEQLSSISTRLAQQLRLLADLDTHLQAKQDLLIETQRKLEQSQDKIAQFHAEFDEQQERLRNQNAQIQHQLADLEQRKQQLASIETQHVATELTLHSRAQAIEEQERELANQSDDLAKRQDAIVAREHNMNEREQELADRVHATDVREIDLNERQDLLVQQQRELEQWQTQTAQIEDELNLRSTELNHRQETLSQLQCDIDRRRDAISEQQIDLDARLSDMTRREQETIRRDEELRDRQEELARQESQLTEKLDELARRQQNLAHEKDLLTTREDTLTRQVQEWTLQQTKLSQNQSELAKREAELEQRIAEFESAETVISRRKEELEHEENALRQQQELLDTQREQLTQAEIRQQQAEDELRIRREQFHLEQTQWIQERDECQRQQSAQHDELNRAATDLQNQRERLDADQTAFTALQQAHRQAVVEFEQRQSHLEEMELALNAKANDLECDAADEQERRSAEMLQRFEQWQKRLDTLEQELNREFTALEQSQQLMLAQQLELAEKTADLSKRESDWEQRYADLMESQHTLADQNQAAVAEQIQLQAERDRLSALQQQIDTDRQRIDQLRGETEASLAEINRKQVELEQRESEWEIRQAELLTQMVDIPAHEEIATEQNILSAEQTEFDRQKIELDLQRTEIESERSKLAAERHEIEVLRVEISTTPPPTCHEDTSADNQSSSIDASEAQSEPINTSTTTENLPCTVELNSLSPNDEAAEQAVDSSDSPTSSDDIGTIDITSADDETISKYMEQLLAHSKQLGMTSGKSSTSQSTSSDTIESVEQGAPKRHSRQTRSNEIHVDQQETPPAATKSASKQYDASTSSDSSQETKKFSPLEMFAHLFENEHSSNDAETQSQQTSDTDYEREFKTSYDRPDSTVQDEAESDEYGDPLADSEWDDDDVQIEEEEIPLEEIGPCHVVDRERERDKLRAFRQVANASANHAIVTHTRKTIYNSLHSRVAVTLISGAISAGLLTSSLWSNVSFEKLGWGALGITLVCSLDLIRTTLGRPRVRKKKSETTTVE
ncbi:MAG: hypothetical protein O3A29_08385 [Planctomycetota bacterium]|nr:hypothetical protein [Planctomycetota bacterium]